MYLFAILSVYLTSLSMLLGLGLSFEFKPYMIGLPLVLITLYFSAKRFIEPKQQFLKPKSFIPTQAHKIYGLMNLLSFTGMLMMVVGLLGGLQNIIGLFAIQGDYSKFYRIFIMGAYAQLPLVIIVESFYLNKKQKEEKAILEVVSQQTFGSTTKKTFIKLED